MDHIHKANVSTSERLHKVFPRLLQSPPMKIFTYESQQKWAELLTVVFNPICTLVSLGGLKHTHTYARTRTHACIMSGPHPRPVKLESLRIGPRSTQMILMSNEG